MFIVTRQLTLQLRRSAMLIAPLSFAPTELGLVCGRCSYEHYAPTELMRFDCGPGRNE
jgi:hypothetical protein